MKTSLPAAPWLPSQYEDEAAIITPDGYFLLNLEGLDVPDKEDTARALRQAVAALPAMLKALVHLKTAADNQEISDKGFRSIVYHQVCALLLIAGQPATILPTA
jgi:hypothetical protein